MRACMPSRFGHVQLFAILLSVAHQAPLSMGFSRQEYWSGSPCPPPRDLPDPGIEPASLMLPALAGGFFTMPEPPGKPYIATSIFISRFCLFSAGFFFFNEKRPI